MRLKKAHFERTCRHCSRKGAAYPRSLCCSCYKDKSIRNQYSILLYQVHGDKIYHMRSYYYPKETKPASNHTTAIPGTKDKVEVMIERRNRGEELFHPADPRLPLPINECFAA